jgi:hypothetical protein
MTIGDRGQQGRLTVKSLRPTAASDSGVREGMPPITIGDLK